MNDGLKQRLIGAIVLLALAVIFVPVIFDREQLQPVVRETQIPLAPDITEVYIPEPKVRVEVEPAPPVEEMFLPEEPIPEESVAELNVEEPEAEEPPGLDEQGVPDAWVLQVASFKDAERAEEFQEVLTSEGYTAYTRLVKSKQGNMTRLFVGPKLDKSQLLKEQLAIEEKFKVSTFILKFEP